MKNPSPFFTFFGFLLCMASSNLAHGALVVPPPTINPTPVLAGSPVTITNSVTGGTAPYTWSVYRGSIGSLVLNNSTGSISGTPNASGSADFTLTLKIQDSSTPAKQTAYKDIKFTITPDAPVLPVATLETAKVGNLFSHTFHATGGKTPYTWSTASALPSGINLNSSTGVLSGTPTQAAAPATIKCYSINVTVKGGNNQSANKTYQLCVAPSDPPKITTLQRDNGLNGLINTPFTPVLQATDGAVPYTWSYTPGAVASKNLPTGLTLNAVGSFSGNPTVAGTFDIAFKVTDAIGKNEVKNLRMIISDGDLRIKTQSLKSAQAEIPYAPFKLEAAGGFPSYNWKLITRGTLPSTFEVLTDGTISGIASVAGTYFFTVGVSDSINATATKNFTLTVDPYELVISGQSISGNKCSTISASYVVTGGVEPYDWSPLPALPASLSFSANGSVAKISGYLTAPVGSYSVNLQATDKNGKSATKSINVTINALPTFEWLTATNLTNGYKSLSYSAPLNVQGGLAPYKFSLKTGSVLPPTLTLNTTTGFISGTPTTVGNYTFTIVAKESSCEALSIERTFNLQIFDAMVVSGTSISGNKCSTITPVQLAVTGGAPPYTWTTIQPPIVPSALTINATTGVVSGTLTAAAGNYSIVVKATDKNGNSATAPLNIKIIPQPPFIWVSSSNLMDGYVSDNYTSQLRISGGIAPYTYSLKAGSVLPTGVTFNSTTNVISGTPTIAGNYTFTVVVNESSCEGLIIEKVFTLRILDSMAIVGLSTFSGNRCSSVVGANYTVTGGSAPFTWSTNPGLPASLSINQTTGRITGNLKSAPGSYSVAVQATDKNGKMASKSVTITINALPTFTWVTTANLTDAYKSSVYNAQLNVTGGIAPYTFSLKAGSTLPAGLSLNATTGRISGTPTTAGNYTFTVVAKESSCDGLSIERAFTLKIFDPISVSGPSISGNKCSSVVGANYTVTGGSAPFTWSTNPGLPASLSINQTTGRITGNLTSAPGSYSVAVQATDKNGKMASKSITITIVALPTFTWVTTANLTDAYKSSAYNAQLNVTGGIAPYTFSLKAGSTLPAGLSLNATTGIISGTPTTAGSYSFTIVATESSCDGLTIERTFNLQVYDPMVISGSPISGIKCNAITPTSFPVTGGAAPITWTTTPSPIVPSALTINATTGVISGVVNGNAGSYTVAVKATDKNGRTATYTSNVTITNPSSLTWVTSTTLPDGYESTNYKSLLSLSGGTPPYTYTLIGTMPNGLALTLNSTTGEISGNLTTAGNYTFCVRASDACAQQADRCFSVKVIKNVILNCVKEIWVVVDYSQDLYLQGLVDQHICSDADFTIKANGESIMNANLNNNGTYTPCIQTHTDYVQTPSGKPSTFIYPHPEFTSDVYGRYNRVVINGANLTTIAAKSPTGVVNFTANCNYSYCANANNWTVCHDPVGRLRIYTTNSTTGNFSQSWAPIFTSNKSNNFSTSLSKNVTICQNSTIALPQALATMGGGLSVVPATLLVDAKKMLPNLSTKEIANCEHLVVQSFLIGRTEVTNQEYCDFLNAVVNETDPHGLYNAAMRSDPNGGIERTGAAGAYSYSVKSGMGNYPVVYVSWFDAARYVNWLANGSPIGALDKTITEDGVYALHGGVVGVGIARNATNPNTKKKPKYWLLNESEWYTSAYLKPSEVDTVSFWNYPTHRDTPSDLTLNDIGNLANHGNIFTGPTEAGFFSESPGPFGTLDQGGNVREWTESVDSGKYRILRGGSWADPVEAMMASESDVADPTHEDDKTGFRIGGTP